MMVYKMIERSPGVVRFSVSLIAFGTFGLFLTILSVALIPVNSLFPSMDEAIPNGLLSMPLFWISTGLSMLIFVSWVVCGIGVLHLREWARQTLRVVMSVHIINIVINICINIFMAQQVFSGVPALFLAMGIAVSVGYYFSVIFFFSHPSVVRQFRFKSREY